MTPHSNADLPIGRFLNEYLPEVLEKERDNTSHVYCYRCNGRWLTFERSAYAACRKLSLDNNVILLTLKADGGMVAMVGLSDEQKSQLPANVEIHISEFGRWKRSLARG